MRRVVSVIAALALGAVAFSSALEAQEHQHSHASALGTVVFPNSGNAAAQASFLRGIALLHSFEYERAARAFREAQGADPKFALAYWAEALTYSRVLWRLEDLAASRSALARLGPTDSARLAMAGTARERSFGAAVETFYSQGSLEERVRRYASALRRHASDDSDDSEASAFAAHAIMLASYMADGGERDALTREAIALAERVARVHPDHPGAIHYLIHLYDNPGMAAEALEFARMYDRIAPGSEHALHMPSHIYLQLGLWADVARSNERAWAASREHGGAGGGPDWHAFSWLQYAYLQQGRWAEARGLIDTARALVPHLPASYVDGRYIVPRLEFQYAVETGQWTSPISAARPADTESISDRERIFRTIADYWRAVDAVQRADPAASALAAPYEALADSIRAGVRHAPAPAARALLISALTARARGDGVAYVQALRAAAEQERLLTAFVGPPERLFALELLGAALVEQGRASEAVEAYEHVLRLCPRRSPALLGLARAKEAAGDRAGAEAAYAELRVNWQRADEAVAALSMR